MPAIIIIVMGQMRVVIGATVPAMKRHQKLPPGIEGGHGCSDDRHDEGICPNTASGQERGI
ncbi:MAG: hypothetical protein J0H26_15510, partial [Alphaproteobacteria bacterium]|nr:hypothetical protein [Alphaproteobacteria bacterium]